MSTEHLSHYRNLAAVTLAALGAILALSNHEATGRMWRGSASLPEQPELVSGDNQSPPLKTVTGQESVSDSLDRMLAKQVIKKIKGMKPLVNNQISGLTLNELVRDLSENRGLHNITPIGWKAFRMERLTAKREYELAVVGRSGRWKIVFRFRDYRKQEQVAEWEYNSVFSGDRLYPVEPRNAPRFWVSEELLAQADKYLPTRAGARQPWQPKDEPRVRDRMLERVRHQHVVRVVSARASANRYVFVGEFAATWRFVQTQAPRRRTDLWLVNKDGSELRRLTYDGESNAPEWCRSGDEIVFIRSGSVYLLGIESKTGGPVIEADQFSWDHGKMSYVEHFQPRISPNAKAIAALTRDGSTAWVTVGKKAGGIICRFAKGAKGYKWSSESELILDYGKFVFDWEGFLSADRQPTRDPELEAPVKAEDPEGDAALRERLLVRLSAQGVKRIEDIVPSRSGSRLVIEGGVNEVKPMLPDTGLWIMNRDGSGLRRLTRSGGNPAWSPSGDEIAFVDGSVSIINLKTGRIRSLAGLQGYHPREGEDVHNRSIYIDAPSWSPNGKAIAASAVNVGGGWVKAADARFGRELIGEFGDTSSYKWNHQGELVVGGYGKLVLDWSSRKFNRH